MRADDFIQQARQIYGPVLWEWKDAEIASFLVESRSNVDSALDALDECIEAEYRFYMH